MYGYKRVNNSSDMIDDDPVGIASAPIRQDGPAENEEEQPHNEPITEDGDIGGIKSWSSTDPYLCLPKEGKMTPEESWSLCAELAIQATREKYGFMRNHIDKLLVFASLFSAVVTAFIIESYKLLRVDHQELTVDLLLRIHYQLDGLTGQNASVALPPLNLNQTLAFEPPSYAVVVNGLWFLSLTLSLGTGFIGILWTIFLGKSDKETRASAKRIVELLTYQEEEKKFIAAGLMYGVWAHGSWVEYLIAAVAGRQMMWSRQVHIISLLGALWVASRFPEDIRAIYAFLHSTEDTILDHGKALVHELYIFSGKQKRLHLELYLRAKLPEQGCDGLHKDLYTAYVLDRFALDSSEATGLKEKLVGHRFELLLRILNEAESYTPSDERPARTITPPIGLGEAQIKNFTSVFFLSGDDHVKNISTESRIQYCETVYMYMQNVRVQRYVVPNSSLVSSDVVRERVAKAIVYVVRIFDVISPQYTEADQAELAKERIEEYKTTHPDYMDSIASLVDTIRLTTSKASVGVPNDLLGTAEQNGWEQLLQLYANHGPEFRQERSPETGKTDKMTGDVVIPMSFDSE
ncbi:hypothetical protein EST38_g5634 [Candolleomyces aberdarensis]|uniref:DUF6535 domain-containing protein n=1 Tax=Candolleomyces aberdarensis TaxID=2316362 RepID=A0A4Q2DJK6_9AGAR|nr:hypothetical protein EST38_g5634 [Candolleomyces aberdarensis]